MAERPLCLLYGAALGNRGGTGVYLERLLHGFCDNGSDDISVVLPEGIVTPRDALAGNHPGGAGKALAELFLIPGLAAGSGARLLHLPAFSGRVPRGMRYAVTLHDLAFMANPAWFPPLKAAWYRLHFPAVARGASLVFTDSLFTAAEARRLLGIEGCRTVYLCAYPPRGPDPGAVKSLGITGRYILCTGTVEPRKNIGALLDAWPSVRSVHGDLELVVAGRWGWGDRSVRRKLLSTEGCRWLGHLPQDALAAACSGARLLVYPSLYEGFGLPPLEAAAAGVPSVIGPAASLSEIFGAVAAARCGADSASISKAILEALETSPDPQRLREFASAFTPSAMAARVHEAYGGAAT
jgi:glycosyltransferase involved in cell wall biosynthesis